MEKLAWREYVRLLLSYAVFTPNDDESWTVEVPGLPGCVTWGQTRADSAQMIEDAMEGWLVTALRFGDPIPVVDGVTMAHAPDAQWDEVAYASTEA